ncbi:hypothetical protein N2152v2_007373 [Parachlorella kessleri]
MACVAHLDPATALLSFRNHEVVPYDTQSHLQEEFLAHPILQPQPASPPPLRAPVFTTVHDGQDEVCFLVYQGDAAIASQNQLVGQFQLGPLPRAPAGSLKIQVTFYLDQDGRLSAEARDIKSGQCFQWRLHSL